MWRVKVVAVGKLKEDYLRAGCREYSKRLSRFARLEEIELKEDSSRSTAREQERWQSAIAGYPYIVACDANGRQLSSPELAAVIQSAGNTGQGAICFLIGGADGLPAEVKNAAQLVLSFGRMSLPHQLFRLVLYEQIYRVFTIINNEPYHCGH